MIGGFLAVVICQKLVCHLSAVDVSIVSSWFVICQPLFRHLSAVGLSAVCVSFVSQ